MTLLRLAPALLLAVYSAALIAIELRTSQDHVRHYFTDIEGPVRLYAINTTLTTFLLWSAALIFSIQLLLLERPAGRSVEKAFCVSQILIFAYLGFDDRFVVHERLSEAWGIHDTLILAAIGAVEAACLLLLGAPWSLPRRGVLYLSIAAAAFLVMASIDAFLPGELELRLSFEDLAKVWSAFFLFLFSWEVLKLRIAEIEGDARRSSAHG